MAAPVWVLSVDLQTKTATFSTGMAQAAKDARGAFEDIKSGAGSMAQETSGHMMEARHSVMILGEEFGVHLPRALTTFIAGLGPIGPALEAAFPFLAVIAGATLLIEHLSKLKEEGEKLAIDQERFGTSTQNAFNGLDQKILEAGVRIDDLRGNHLAALHKQLQIIDLQTMGDLVHQFDLVDKAADVVFADLKTHWYQSGVGSEGAKHSLDEFQAQYESLIAQGKSGDASELLKGTRETAERTLTLMKQMQGSNVGLALTGGDIQKFTQAREELIKIGAIRETTTEIGAKDLQSQEAILAALSAQATVEEKVAALKKAQDEGAKLTANKAMGKDADQLARAQAEGFRIQQELEQKAQEEGYRIALQALQTSEKEKIDATKEGSEERLAAIQASIQEENGYGLQETGFYQELLTSRVKLIQQMSDEQAKIAAEARKLAAEHTQKMGELQLAADQEAAETRLSGLRVTLQQRIDLETEFANREYELQASSLAQQIAALDKSDKDYDNKLQALYNKQEELTKEHENKVTTIRDQAEKDRNKDILNAEGQLNADIARGLSSLVTGHQSAAQMILSIGDEIAEGMLQTAIKSMLADDMTKEKDAAAAARKAYLAGMHFPFPANLVMAPLLGAMAFASVMAFEEGSDRVPGVGKGDTVPAMLTPGEGVVPGGTMDKLNSLAARGGLDGGSRPHVQVHYRPTYHVQAIDRRGVREMLDTHKEEFANHMHSELRKLNR